MGIIIHPALRGEAIHVYHVHEENRITAGLRASAETQLSLPVLTNRIFITMALVSPHQGVG